MTYMQRVPDPLASLCSERGDKRFGRLHRLIQLRMSILSRNAKVEEIEYRVCPASQVLRIAT